MLGISQRLTVQFIEHVLGPQIFFRIFELSRQKRTERFQNRKNNPPVAAVNRHILHKIEVAVGLFVQLLIQLIHVEDLYERLVAQVDSLLQVRIVDTSLVVFINNSQLEPLSVNLLIAKSIDVFHHQVPHR